MSLFPHEKLVNKLIKHGELTVITHDGKRQIFGTAQAGPSVTIRIHDPRFVRRLVRRPGLMLGEGYMDEAYTLEHGTLHDFLEIVLISAARRKPAGFVSDAIARTASLIRRNDGDRASRNIRHHYDIDHRLYEMFLDEDLQYSCAYWRDGVTSLEEAQRDKKDHIARKLLLEPGMNVLDIGCGWGGLAITLARDYGANVTGVTLSTDQFETASRRVQEQGLGDRVSIKLQDYREEKGTYDRIVSVGMFEHVGPRNFGEFYDRLDGLLAPDGVALVHTIGRMAIPEPINPWMRKYIFPGAYLPSLSQLMPLLEKRGLWLGDLEMLRVHYAKTLEAWDQRFQARRSDVESLFDARFCRMWEFYLQLNVLAFRHRSLVVFQLQLSKRIDAVPLTRDYLYGDKEINPARSSGGASAPD
jgi:cyclopropane-fatty-acyl-phospholipid synthase